MLRFLVTRLCNNFFVEVPLETFDLGRNLPPEVRILGKLLFLLSSSTVC